VPDFVVIGNVTEDITPSGVRLGGTATYAASVAAKLGASTGIVTRCHPALDLSPLPAGVAVFRLASDSTTLIEHRFDDGRRRQFLRARAGNIIEDHIPPLCLAAPTVLLGPVIGEVDPAVVFSFPRALIGAGAQGWLRRVGRGREIEGGEVEGLRPREFAGRVSILTLSEEDLAGAAIPDAWLQAFSTLIVTDARHGLRLRHDRRWWRLPAFPAQELDATGAGDALAAAFLLRYAETRDPCDAARFGAAAASFVVEGPGIMAAAGRAAVEARLRAHPEIQLIRSGD